MSEKPLILITNDDGVAAKGITELIESLKGLGELLVFAPDGPRSGMSGAITSAIPIKYSLIKKEEDLTIYSCTGTPVDCVKLAIHSVVNRQPALLVSGINHGTNVAICVHYSGTMGATIEGCILDIPSIGLSLTDHSANADFSESCRMARIVAEMVLKDGLPKGTYLNVNIPNVPDVKGIKVCHQATGRWVNEFMCSTNASQQPVYWLTGEFRNSEPDKPENDTMALDEGYVSVVPCKIDVTDYDHLDDLEKMINRIQKDNSSDT